MIKILSLILSFLLGFFTYPISFLPANADTVFEVKSGSFSADTVTFNGEDSAMKLSGHKDFGENGMVINSKATLEFENPACDWFNYFGIRYSSDSYIKGEISYRAGVTDKSEEFFLEPGENAVFYSFIDNCLDKTKANAVYSLSFEPLNNETAQISIGGISVFNREIPEQEIYIEADSLKIGVDLLWGGALSYMEDLDSNVEAVRVDGKIKVDSNAGTRYGAEVVNKNVNLINRNDTGRLVQQSYYGTNSGGYECGEYMGNKWSYNPVQGGNQFNESSKIVDIRTDENSIYIKCRPLDWAKAKEFAAPAYMEASYSIDNKMLRVSCRFVDFSGLPETSNTQELPAFYCVEPLNRFVYYAGDKPWTNDALTVEPSLIFWPDAGYPNFNSSENWSAFIGEFDDSFGIGLYVPNETRFLSGVFSRGETTNTDPSKDSPTSYIALTKYMLFKSFSPFEYDFYLTTGNSTEIRNNFSILK